MNNPAPNEKKHRGLGRIFKRDKTPERPSDRTTSLHDSAYASLASTHSRNEDPSRPGPDSVHIDNNNDIPNLKASDMDKNLSYKPSTGEIVDDDTGETITVVTTTTTTTTTTTRKGAGGKNYQTQDLRRDVEEHVQPSTVTETSNSTSVHTQGPTHDPQEHMQPSPSSQPTSYQTQDTDRDTQEHTRPYSGASGSSYTDHPPQSMDRNLRDNVQRFSGPTTAHPTNPKIMEMPANTRERTPERNVNSTNANIPHTGPSMYNQSTLQSPSPTIPARNPNRKSGEYVYEPAAGHAGVTSGPFMGSTGDSPPSSPSRHNFSYPSRAAPPAPMPSYQNPGSPISPISSHPYPGFGAATGPSYQNPSTGAAHSSAGMAPTTSYQNPSTGLNRRGTGASEPTWTGGHPYEDSSHTVRHQPSTLQNLRAAATGIHVSSFCSTIHSPTSTVY